MPKKARSTRLIQSGQNTGHTNFPSLLTYFRQGRLDKFFLANSGINQTIELDFFNAAGILKPADPAELRLTIPRDFYTLLEINRNAFEAATSAEIDDAVPKRKGSANDAYILKRLKAKEITRYHGFTDDDEAYIRQVIQLLNDGALPKPTTKTVAEALKKEAEP